MQTPVPTPYSDLNHVLETLVNRLQETLPKNLVGVYLQGSFAVGDFDQYSDVDFIVVTEDALSEDEVQALQELHGSVYEMESPWAQHLEGSYFPKDILRQHEDCSAELWYLDNGSRSLIQSNHCNTVIVRWVVRDMGIALAGPPPISLVDPIPVSSLRRQIADVAIGWGEEILAEPQRYANHFYQLFILQNYCRMLHDYVQGYPGSKRAATDWAKETLDPQWHELIERSWETRGEGSITVRQPANVEDYQATLRFVRYIIDKIKV